MLWVAKKLRLAVAMTDEIALFDLAVDS